jgi:flagellar protein FliO/FliZ
MDGNAVEIAAGTSQIPGFWFMILKSFGMLLIVLGVLFAVALIIKKLSGFKKGTIKDEIKLVSLFHLAPKEKIVLVEVDDKRILLGVTPQSINNLGVFDKKSVEKFDEPVKKTENFAGILEKKVGPVISNDSITGEKICENSNMKTE